MKRIPILAMFLMITALIFHVSAQSQIIDEEKDPALRDRIQSESLDRAENDDVKNFDQNMKMIKDLIAKSAQSPDRDQKYTLRAEREVQEFLQRFPDSEYAPVVRNFLKEIRENLALGDFRIALFYSDKGNFTGAMGRLKTIINSYPNFSRIEDVHRLYGALSIVKMLSQPSQEGIK